jgi:hypothetical protein
MSLATILVVGAVLLPPAPRHTFFLPNMMSWQESVSTQSAARAALTQETPKEATSSEEPKESSKPAEPDTKSEPPADALPSQNSEPAAAPAKARETNTAKPTTKTGGSKRKQPKKAAAQPGSPPAKRVVRNGSTGDPEVQLSPGITRDQASHQRQRTAELLAATETNLKTISGRQLGVSQQEAVTQIHRYITQAKEADDAGDLQRARNLAFKARLLSDDLVKH